MRSNTLKKKLQKKQVTIGSWITIGNEIVAEIMAKAGFEWLVVDMEHSAIDLPQAQKLVRVIDLCGCIPLIRVGENNNRLIKRAMDTGAYGVIVPMVNSREDAQKAVGAVHYPPLGKRGVGLARAQGYGISFEDYKKWLRKESVIIVQVEHVESVRNLESILSVPGIDGFVVGPYDISGSIGQPGNFSHPLVKKNLRNIMSTSKVMKANAGIHVIEPDPQEVTARIKEGYKIIAFSLDSLILSRFCQDQLKKIKRS